jgi:hypothetical protein
LQRRQRLCRRAANHELKKKKRKKYQNGLNAGLVGPIALSGPRANSQTPPPCRTIFHPAPSDPVSHHFVGTLCGKLLIKHQYTPEEIGR